MFKLLKELFQRKKVSPKDEQCTKLKPITASQNNDQLLDQNNREYLTRRRNEVAKLTTKYNFETIEGINAIPVPAPPINEGSTTGQLDYYLRLRASEYKREKKMDLAIACLYKANALMPYSVINWSGKDYLRLAQYLRAGKQFEAARTVENDLKKRFPELFDDGTISAKKRLIEQIKVAKQMQTDLLEMTSHSPTCGECAKYQGRVYSISGQDTRYPPLPELIKNNGRVHSGCRHCFFPYFHGSPTANHQNALTFSNRPFVDDRTDDEIKAYDIVLARRADEQQKKADREIYDLICEKLPDIAPKSFSGYRKMKKANSPAFQDLNTAAIQAGIKIPPTGEPASGN